MRRSILFQFVLTLAIFASFFGSPEVKANLLNRFATCMTLLIEKPYLKSMERLDQSSLLIQESGTGRYIALSLDRQLGAGFFGSALLVNFVSDPEWEKEIRTTRGYFYAGELVAKIPHALKWLNFGLPLFHANNENKTEVKIYQHLLDHLPAVESDPLFPKGVPFRRGRLPVPPILGALDSARGFFVFKPKIIGRGLKELAVLALENGGHLPEPYLSGLRSHYDFVQAVNRHVPTYGFISRIAGGKGFSTDIRPPNLVWVEDPKTLQVLGYWRPGFAAYEMAQVPYGQQVYINSDSQSFDRYLAEFESYMGRELQETSP